LLTGRTFLGSEAVDYGVATQALPAAEVLPAAMAMANDIANNTAPVSVALAKQLLWESVGIDIDAFRDREFKLFAATTRLPDALEGPMAFLEKRAPKWAGVVSTDIPTV
jgi:enoyl-CoA hydratase/carnithine racemase